MNKLKAISLMAAAVMMTGSVALADTYTVTGNGYHGEMSMDVTIENGVITDVVLGDNHETNVVIDRAFPVIRDRHPCGEHRGCGQRERGDLLFLRGEDGCG